MSGLLTSLSINSVGIHDGHITNRLSVAAFAYLPGTSCDQGLQR